MTNNQIFKQTEIGKIPNGWEGVAIKEICRVKRGASPRPIGDPSYFSDSGRGWIRISDVTDARKFLRKTSQCLSKKGEEKSVKVNPGDLIMSICATIGKPIILDMEACIHDGFVWFSELSSNVNVEYFFYLLEKNEITFSRKRQTGTQGNINTNLVGATLISLPPPPEQKKIAEILSTVDQAIEKVDEGVKKTQKLKKGLMQELLTRGIGHKEFRDTEIGRIPKDWNVVRISDIADVKGGKRLPKGQKLVNSKTPYPYIRVLDFRDMGVDVSNVQFLLPDTHKSIRQYIISSDDVYISIAGTVGIVGLIPFELDNANLTENAAKLCNLRNITKEFLAYVLNSSIGQSQISVYLGKAQQPKLALFRIEKIRLPIPSLVEQQKIAEILDAVDERLELLRKRKGRLERIKKGLMNDLLTGKVRVTSLISEEEFHERT